MGPATDIIRVPGLWRLVPSKASAIFRVTCFVAALGMFEILSLEKDFEKGKKTQIGAVTTARC
jgi:hypothetical protein